MNLPATERLIGGTRNDQVPTLETRTRNDQGLNVETRDNTATFRFSRKKLLMKYNILAFGGDFKILRSKPKIFFCKIRKYLSILIYSIIFAGFFMSKFFV